MSTPSVHAAAGGVRVVIVTCNSADTIAQCLQHVLAAQAVAEVVVVDNASDDAPDAWMGDDTRLRLIRNQANRGFGPACNQGAAGARRQWLAFVNPDCFVTDTTFTALIAAADSDPRLGLLGADVRDVDGRPENAARRRDPTLRRILSTLLGRSLPGDADSLYCLPAAAQAITAVDAVSGALMLVDQALFERLGGFDEGYRLHAEDLDLCRRVRAVGRAVAVAEGAQATHIKGTSSRRRPLFVAWNKHRGLARYFRKFGGGSGALSTFAAVAGIWLMFTLKLPLLGVSLLRRAS